MRPRIPSALAALCWSWINDPGAAQDGAGTVETAKRALDGDPKAMRVVLSWGYLG